MKLGVKDQRVLRAFAERLPAGGHKLSTDGERLDGHWMGGSNIAEWAAGHVVFHDLGSRAAQSVQRAVRQLIPDRQLAVWTPPSRATARAMIQNPSPAMRAVMDANPALYGRRK